MSGQAQRPTVTTAEVFDGRVTDLGHRTAASLEALAALVADVVVDRMAGAAVQPVLVDAAVAAQLLSVPKTWLLAEARAGRVPHRRLGKYVRFCRAELTAWATGEGETGSGPVPATPDRRVPTGIRDASKASDTNGTTNSGAQRAA